MAEILVNSEVMRQKSEELKNSADKLKDLFEQMKQEVQQTAGSMEGTAIETQKERFVSMEPRFDTIRQDMTDYSTFLQNAAEAYEQLEQTATQNAEVIGSAF